MTGTEKTIPALPGMVEATSEFESWLSGQLPIIKQDLRSKHQAMAQSAFSFFRATFYRWLQLWPVVCDEMAKAPSLLAVGDLHIENFGTWRDLEGRLIWGINDLDEVYPASYAIDLVRLTSSAYLAIEEEHLSIPRSEAAEAVEQGYRDCFAAGGRAFVLAEQHRWLRLMALGKLRDPVHFWEKITRLPPFTLQLPQEVRELLEQSLPEGSKYQLKRRVAGLGSLGHPRILAVSSLRGALIAREAKAIRPSAWVWAKKLSSHELYGAKLAQCSLRVQDPFVRFHDKWLIRRLAPDCSRIELSSLPKERDEARLLHAMGWEAANLHLASKNRGNVKRDLAGRKGNWLHKAAKAMCKATLSDWREWRRNRKRSEQR